METIASDLREAPTRREPTLLVGVGASAGGLEALEQTFDGLPSAVDFAIVVVTHLSPDFRSLLDELLARRTSMPVHLAEDGMSIEAGAVYVLPPKKEMIVSRTHLYLRERESQNVPPIPIDTFFRSIAREWGERAVGVILSGSGSDGSRGVVDIKEHGGLVFVQDPSTARFAGMPEAAIETGCFDRILEPSDIGDAVSLATQRDPVMNSDFAGHDHELAAMERIIAAVFGVSDIDFSCYKTATFRRRVERRMATTAVSLLGDYASLVEKDPEEARRLSDDLLIGVTDFFRDPDGYDRLLAVALEELIVRKATEGAPIRIWTAGCATGQEPYSLAILISEAAARLKRQVAVQIFATDIREEYLEKASRGVYSSEEVRGIDPDLRKKYFFSVESVGEPRHQIRKELRQWVVFARHDLLKAPPFTKIDLITCRNVLIYFNIDMQQRLFALFHFALNADGVIFLGPSESLGELEREFISLDQRWRIYRKAHDRPLHVGPTASVMTSGMTRSRPSPNGTAHRFLARRKEIALLPAYNALLEQFAPTSGLVSADRELLHIFGAGRKFLRPPSGVTNLDIVNMVDSGLRAPLATGIERCLRERREIVFPDLPIRDDDIASHIRLRVLPLVETNAERVEHLLVTFEEREPLMPSDDIAVMDMSTEDISLRRVEELELELKRTRETLQATIEEVETSNEELQSSNEELMASNEELQSTNEELNSVNEELYSVNAEYQRQNEELVGLNQDMESLLKSTNIGVVFVDHDLKIRRCTSAASQLFNIISEDVGRRLGHLTHQFVDFEPEDFIRETIESGEIREREVLSRGNVWWMLRCVAHGFSSGAKGAVLTVVNIDRLKSAEITALDAAGRFRLIAQLAQAIYREAGPTGEIVQPQPQWAALTGGEFDAYRGFGWLEWIHEDDRDVVAGAWRASTVDRRPMIQTKRVWSAKHGEWRHMRMQAEPTLDPAGAIVSWSVVVVDVHELVETKQAVAVRDRMLKSVTAVSPSLLSYVDANRRYAFVNKAYEQRWGRPAEDFIGKTMQEVMPSYVMEQAAASMDDALAGRRVEYTVDRTGPEGEQVYFEIIYEPDVDADGVVRGVASHARDLSDAKEELMRKHELKAVVMRGVDELGEDVVVFDPQSLSIEYVNHSGRERLGYTMEALQGMALNELTPSVSAEKWRGLVRQSPPGGVALPPIQAFLMKRDGDTYDCDIRFSSVREQDRVYGVATFTDISERLEVARTLRQRTAELAASNRDLEQFASVASHDLRAPLRHISSFVSMVLEDHGAALPDKAKEHLNGAVASAARLQEMVASLLDYSRLGASKRELTKVSLDAVVAVCAKDVADDLAEAGATLTVDPLPEVLGDAGLLERVFQNLVANAVKYRADRPLKIRISEEPSDAGARIIVCDNGIGVPEGHGEQIFEIFARLRPERSSADGVGLGLALCRRIMEIHNGRIWLDPNYRDGARFVVDFPKDEART